MHHAPVKKYYWRGLTLAHTGIWNDFCVHRMNISLSDDKILILEDDAVCVTKYCEKTIDTILNNQVTDIVYLGWCRREHDYQKPPLCTHAYSITCAGVLKLRDTIDPCGKPIDLQLQSRGIKGVYDWDFAYRSNYELNKTVFSQIDATNANMELVFDSGIFMQVKNKTNFMRGDKGHSNTFDGYHVTSQGNHLEELLVYLDAENFKQTVDAKSGEADVRIHGSNYTHNFLSSSPWRSGEVAKEPVSPSSNNTKVTTATTLHKSRKMCVQFIVNNTKRLFFEAVGPKSFSGDNSNSEVIYYGPATHRNLGDNLLVLGSISLLESFNKKLYFCGDSQSNYASPRIARCSDEEIKQRISKTHNGFIYYHPGGNWGDLYLGAHNSRMHVLRYASDNNISVISGPQTLYYKDRKNEESDKVYLNSFLQKASIKFLWRQHNSYEYAQHNYQGFQSFEIPDVAFQIGVVEHLRRGTFDAVLLLRDDKETLLSPTSASGICKKLAFYNLTCKEITWSWPMVINNGSDFDTQDIRSYLDSVWKQASGVVSLGKVVITDRLHGVIVSYMAGKGVVYIENLSNKTQNTLATSFNGLEDKCLGENKDPGFKSALGEIDDIVSKTLEMLKNIVGL